MDTFVISKDLYAIFKYFGLVYGTFDFSKNIFNVWILKAGLFLDHRPHFEEPGDQYSKMNQI